MVWDKQVCIGKEQTTMVKESQHKWFLTFGNSVTQRDDCDESKGLLPSLMVSYSHISLLLPFSDTPMAARRMQKPSGACSASSRINILCRILAGRSCSFSGRYPEPPPPTATPKLGIFWGAIYGYHIGVRD